MSQAPYHPISCDLYDDLVLAAMRKARIKLTAHHGDPPTCAEGIIEEIFTAQGAEWARLSDGSRWRLDEVTWQLIPHTSIIDEEL